GWSVIEPLVKCDFVICCIYLQYKLLIESNRPQSRGNASEPFSFQRQACDHVFLRHRGVVVIRKRLPCPYRSIQLPVLIIERSLGELLPNVLQHFAQPLSSLRVWIFQLDSHSCDRAALSTASKTI